MASIAKLRGFAGSAEKVAEIGRIVVAENGVFGTGDEIEKLLGSAALWVGNHYSLVSPAN